MTRPPNLPSQDSYETFIEVYGGSGSLLFLKDPSPVEIYNDIDENVYSLFKVLTDEDSYNAFKYLCDLSLYSSQLRQEFKEDLKTENITPVGRAFRFWYVNRTSYNGVGGFSRNQVIRRGMAKCISDFLSSIDRLPEIHNRLSRVIIENRDGIELLKLYNK